MHGEWKTRSGAPITLSAITRTEAPPFLYFQIKDGREPGYDLSVTVDLDWEASEKAFRMWDGEKSIQEGRTVFMYEQTRGYVWPSAGEDADSETLRMEYNSGGETFEAVLERVKT